MSSTTYKLVYFDGRGRAEMSRYLFVLNKTPYEDSRIKMEQWPELKPKTPYGQLPVLHVNDTVYCQSEAIARYLARKFGFYGETPEESLVIDQIISAISDLLTELFKVRALTQDEEKEKGRQKLVSESVPHFIGFLDKQLQGGDWFVGGKVSLADVVVYELLTNDPLTGGDLGEWRAHSSAVAALVDRFAALPEIAAYIAARPTSKF